jgi:hypothetical protein
VPSKHSLSRTFGDVWQLLLDVPGGRLADADLRADADAPRMGPWKRCFTCVRGPADVVALQHV